MAGKLTTYDQFKQLLQQGFPPSYISALIGNPTLYQQFTNQAAQEGLIKSQGFPIGNVATGALGGLLTGGPVGALGGAVMGGIGSQHGQGALQSGLTGAAIGGVARGVGSALGAQSGFNSPLGSLTGQSGPSGTGTTGGLGSLSTPFGKVSLGDLAKLGIAGLGTLSASKQQGRGNAIAEQMAQQNAALAADRAKLRQQFLGRIGNLPSQAPDLGSLFQSANPFSRTSTANLGALQALPPSPVPQGPLSSLPQMPQTLGGFPRRRMFLT